MNSFNYRKRTSDVIQIGELSMGGNHPIVLQSMTDTSTMDTDACVAQIQRILANGADLVRLTAQGVKEAANLQLIKAALHQQGISVPLSADIHFNHKAAFEAALHVEKVRINPGNFINPSKNQSIEEIFIPLLQLCTEKGTALRIGVNHGSLSERILQLYGDTPKGMVESCMEYLRICHKEHFKNVVISMKSSNTMVMVQSVRLLVDTLNKEGMNYPLHLGVTEAGEGEDGRIKSAVGIGALLVDGIGDTIRVSLSEDPELEIPVAKKLVNHVVSFKNHTPIEGCDQTLFNPFQFSRRASNEVLNIGNKQVPVIIANAMRGDWQNDAELQPDFIYCGQRPQKQKINIPQILHQHVFEGAPNTYAIYDVSNMHEASKFQSKLQFLHAHDSELNDALCQKLKEGNWVVLLHSMHDYVVGEVRSVLSKLKSSNVPVIVGRNYTDENLEDFQLKTAMDVGCLLLDGLIDGLFMNNYNMSNQQIVSTQYGILQAARARISKTEYISCPGCGRTHFALKEVIARIREATQHLKGLKIGIMGCIVNGPGEMADADYGYVGAGTNKISIYKGQECIEKNIDERNAVSRLIELIKEHGDWVDHPLA